MGLTCGSAVTAAARAAIVNAYLILAECSVELFAG